MSKRADTRWGSMRWAPVVMIVGAVGFEVLAPPEYAATPVMAAACVMAGAILTLAGASTVVAVSVCAVVAVAVGEHRWGHVGGSTELADIVAAGLVALWVNRLVTRQRARLAVARGVAEEMQRVLLPVPPGTLDGLEVAARYEAAHAEARVGGDLYAVQQTPHGVRLLVGDVRGKGLDAVATVSALVGAFREGAGQEADLLALADRLEDALDREAARADGFERRFATAILAEVSPCGSRLRLLNRGHPAAYLLDEGRVQALLPAESDLPLGLRDLAERRSAVMDVSFPKGAVLVMMTDGVTEARGSSGTFYDPGQGLAALALGPTAQQTVDFLAADVDRWVDGPAADDRAILAVRRGQE